VRIVEEKALRIIQDSVPVLAKACRPAESMDKDMLAYIWKTQPKISLPAPAHVRLPKDLDILAELQDVSGFDVRSWHGTVRQQCLLEELLDLLLYHLVLPLSFPMRLLCVTACGEELIVNSDQTLKATIQHVLPSRDRSGRARIVIAVRRAMTPLFHTSVRHAAALRVQGAVRVHNARRRFDKTRARAFKKGLYLGRYKIQGLPSLCQHRHLVAHLCRTHALTQPQALALVSRKLESLAREMPQWQVNREDVAKLAVRVKPSAPLRAAETLRGMYVYTYVRMMYTYVCVYIYILLHTHTHTHPHALHRLDGSEPTDGAT
jgi:hypothetical protein